MAVPKGVRIGGRQKGTPNKINFEAQETLARIGLNPLEAMAKMALGDVECSCCQGKGVILLKSYGGEIGCEACNGSGKDHISPELKGKMLSELSQYVAPKRKAVEMETSVRVGLLELLSGLPQDAADVADTADAGEHEPSSEAEAGEQAT